MAVLATNTSGHLQNQLTRSLERILEDANQSGELKLSNRKLKDFPKAGLKYNLSDTVIADLSKNRFSELPEEVTSFYFLERLQCYHNTIRYIPDTVGSLQCLNYLDLSRNQLTSLPREICQLPIQILLVSNNRLTSLPDELCRMYRLTELDASCNQLTHLPPRLGELTELQSLILRSNQLLCVPIEITYLQLVRLDLRANRIGCLPLEMRDMDSLIEFYVDDNPLTLPPASLCKRGRIHIFKHLENEAIRLGHKITSNLNGTLSRRPGRRSVGSSNATSASSTPVPPTHIPERLKHKRANVDSGYSTSSDDKRWSQELTSEMDKHWSASTPVMNRLADMNGSSTSTPSTISPGPDGSYEESTFVLSGSEQDVCDKRDRIDKETNSSARLSPCHDNITNGNGIDDKNRPLHQIQTYREYKEALRQQRAHDIGSIYRPKDADEQGYKTEPNTPTHQPTRTTLATSKSDPTPLNAVLSSPKHIFDDTSGSKKPVQKVQPSRLCNTIYASPQTSPGNPHINGNGLDNNKKYICDYVKPSSPVKATSGIMTHDNVPITNGCSNSKPGSPRVRSNGFKPSRTMPWSNGEALAQKDRITFTMRREIDKAREETDLINQLRTILEARLKMALPADLAPALTDGVVLCHLANQIRPRSVATIHVPSPAVPKLTMARCRRNVDNFLEACRKIGVDENMVCCSSDVLEGRGVVQVAITVIELVRFHSPKSPQHSASAATAT